MKNKSFIFLLFFISSVIFAEEERVRFLGGTIDALFYIDILETFSKKDIALIIENENGNTYLDIGIKDSLYLYYATFSDSQRELIRGAIAKYKEWNTIAIREKQNIEKSITNFNIDSMYFTFQSSEEGDYMDDVNIRILFLSQNTNRHQMVLIFEKLTGTINEYFTADPPSIYLDYDAVLKLEKLIDEKSITEFIKNERERRKKTDDLFK